MNQLLQLSFLLAMLAGFVISLDRMTARTYLLVKASWIMIACGGFAEIINLSRPEYLLSWPRTLLYLGFAVWAFADSRRARWSGRE